MGNKWLILLGCVFGSNFCWSQNIDTATLKDVISKELNRQGLQNPVFELNVKSVNQSGGQTAFIINNVVYGDTAFSVPDKDNFICKKYSYRGKDGILVYPKKGKWYKPFCWYPKLWMKDTANMVVCIVNGGFSFPPGDGQFSMPDKNYNCIAYSFADPCSKALPLFIEIDYKAGFVIFGDRSDENKWYEYNFEEVTHFTRYIGHINQDY